MYFRKPRAGGAFSLLCGENQARVDGGHAFQGVIYFVPSLRMPAPAPAGDQVDGLSMPA